MNDTPNHPTLSLRPVGADNWRAVAQLTVSEEQRAFVAEPAYYLAMCAYGELWRPLAIEADGQTVGFLMWAVDPADQSCWLGGILVDQSQQRRGYGRQAIRAVIAQLAAEHGHRHFALSYNPANSVAKALYRELGFAETGEQEDDEVVARLKL
ncbi:MAG TPA: GNAT family N-acetyltransferase [Herpetosiphonaceae bacterium]|nr:GNAT family N-acetyltransferase [Herpetosiphonaceae bacterium]